jgi:hypothetical protein
MNFSNKKKGKHMRYALLIFMLFNHCFTFSMENTHNTYKGVPITPQSLLELAPQTPEDLLEQVGQCMEKHHNFISSLVTTPHPLTHRALKKKTTDNFALIAQYEEKNIAKNHSLFNYVLRFNEHPTFSMPINRWGSRVAYWIYASDQGNVLNGNLNDNFDCSLIEYIPSYQHCSRLAHYLRVKEVAEKKNFQVLRPTPTYITHIPGKANELSDENYVVVQEWINDFQEIKNLPERQRITIKGNMSFDIIKELYEATVYAALWDIASNLGVDKHSCYLHIADLEEPFNHKPQFFYFQGEEGKKKYVEDVIAGLERMARFFLEDQEQFNIWKKLSEEDIDFNSLCNHYDIHINYDPEYLRTKD